MMKFEIPPVPDEKKSSKEMMEELIKETREEHGIPTNEVTPLDTLKEGRPEEVAARRAAYYEGKPLAQSEKPESKGVGTERLDTEAYQRAYREYLLDPKKFDGKPELEDFPLGKKEDAA